MQNLTESITNRTALQEMLKKVLQAVGNDAREKYESIQRNDEH